MNKNVGFENVGSENVGSENVGSENVGLENVGSENVGSENPGNLYLNGFESFVNKQLYFLFRSLPSVTVKCII